MKFIVLTNNDGDRFLLRADLIFRVTPRTVGVRSIEKECLTTVTHTAPNSDIQQHEFCQETVESVQRKLNDAI